MNRYERILIGGSAGSVEQVIQLFNQPLQRVLPPVVYACHMTHKEGVESIREVLSKNLSIPVVIAQPGDELLTNHFYISPADYHLLLEEDGRIFRFYDDGPYLGSKPSLNLFFMSCNGHTARSTLAILLSGANTDGADGLHSLSIYGALCAVADPEHSQFDIMPRAAINLLDNCRIIPHTKEQEWLEKII